jgi:sugar phosphate isomerase/epimerase
MDVHRLSLAHLGMSDAGPVPLVEGGAGAGFRAVGLPLRSGALKPLKFEIVGNRPLIRDIKSACQASGITIFDVESLVLGHEPVEPDLRRTFETAAELGASRMSCLGAEVVGDRRDPVEGRHAERLARIAVIAAEFGLRIGVEFMMFRAIRTLADAVQVVAQAAQPNVGIIIDALHLGRSGGTPADVAALAPELISHCQLCDADPVAPQLEGLVDEARTGRRLPGTGILPLRELLQVIPRQVPLALEAPIRGNAHLPIAERARLAAAAIAAF